MEELKNFFTEEIAESFINGTATEEVKVLLISIYKKVFRKDVSNGCNQCTTDAFFELYNLYKSNEELFVKRFTCLYALKAGAVLMIFGDTDTICTKDNVTDELAELHLSANPECISQFERYPDNYQEIIAEKAVATVEETQPEPKAKKASK